MVLHAVTYKAVALLGRNTDSPWFPLLLGTCALLATVTLTLPVELLVAIGVLISPLRWIAIGLCAAIGSSLASVGLYLAFHHLGWSLLIEWYPDITTSEFWAQSTTWLSEYGAIALFALMALPLPVPKTPALVFVAIYRMPIYEVVLAIGLGKSLKYVLYAFVVSRFPKQIARWYDAAIPGQVSLVEMRTQTERAVSIKGSEKVEVRRRRIWRAGR